MAMALTLNCVYSHPGTRVSGVEGDCRGGLAVKHRCLRDVDKMQGVGGESVYRTPDKTPFGQTALDHTGYKYASIHERPEYLNNNNNNITTNNNNNNNNTSLFCTPDTISSCTEGALESAPSPQNSCTVSDVESAPKHHVGDFCDNVSHTLHVSTDIKMPSPLHVDSMSRGIKRARSPDHISIGLKEMHSQDMTLSWDKPTLGSGPSENRFLPDKLSKMENNLNLGPVFLNDDCCAQVPEGNHVCRGQLPGNTSSGTTMMPVESCRAQLSEGSPGLYNSDKRFGPQSMCFLSSLQGQYFTNRCTNIPPRGIHQHLSAIENSCVPTLQSQSNNAGSVSTTTSHLRAYPARMSPPVVKTPPISPTDMLGDNARYLHHSSGEVLDDSLESCDLELCHGNGALYASVLSAISSPPGRRACDSRCPTPMPHTCHFQFLTNNMAGHSSVPMTSQHQDSDVSNMDTMASITHAISPLTRQANDAITPTTQLQRLSLSQARPYMSTAAGHAVTSLSSSASASAADVANVQSRDSKDIISRTSAFSLVGVASACALSCDSVSSRAEHITAPALSRVTIHDDTMLDDRALILTQGHSDQGARVEQGQSDQGARVEQDHSDQGARVEQGHSDQGARVEQGHSDQGARVEQGHSDPDEKGIEKLCLAYAIHHVPQNTSHTSLDHVSRQSTAPKSSNHVSHQNTPHTSFNHVPHENAPHTSSNHVPHENAPHTSSNHVLHENAPHTSSNHVHPENAPHTSSNHVPHENAPHTSADHVHPESAPHTSSDHVPPESAPHTSSDHVPPENAQHTSSDHVPPENAPHTSADNVPPESAPHTSSDRHPPADDVIEDISRFQPIDGATEHASSSLNSTTKEDLVADTSTASMLIEGPVTGKRKLDSFICDEDNFSRGQDSPPLDRPAKRLTLLTNTPKQRKEERRKILRVSVQKLREMDERKLLERSVLIRNTVRKIQEAVREEKKNRIPFTRSLPYGYPPFFRTIRSCIGYNSVVVSADESNIEQDLNGSCVYDSPASRREFLFEDPLIHGDTEKITDDMTETLLNNLEVAISASSTQISTSDDLLNNLPNTTPTTTFNTTSTTSTTTFNTASTTSTTPFNTTPTSTTTTTTIGSYSTSFHNLSSQLSFLPLSPSPSLLSRHRSMIAPSTPMPSPKEKLAHEIDSVFNNLICVLGET